MSNLLHLGIAILVACILFYIFTPDDIPKYKHTNPSTSTSTRTFKNELTYKTLVEPYDGGFSTFSQIPNEFLGITANSGDDDVEVRRKKIFKYFSNFLEVYCNVNKEDLEAKTNSFIAKLYNFVQNKIQRNTYVSEITKEMPGDMKPLGIGPNSGSPFDRSGQIKGQLKYPNSGKVIIFIVLKSTKFSDEEKIDILAALGVATMPSSSMYDPINNTIDMRRFPGDVDCENGICSYEKFKNILYDSLTKVFEYEKIIDPDIYNYNLCV